MTCGATGRCARNGATERIAGVLHIAADAREVGRARAWVAQRIRKMILSPSRVTAEVIDNVALCACEVITNAVVHGGRGRPGEQVTIVLRHRAPVLRVEVTDRGGDPERVPHVRDAAPDSDIDGRGLKIVEVLARRWGHYTDAAGRTVWFEVEH